MFLSIFQNRFLLRPQMRHVSWRKIFLFTKLEFPMMFPFWFIVIKVPEVLSLLISCQMLHLFKLVPKSVELCFSFDLHWGLILDLSCHLLFAGKRLKTLTFIFDRTEKQNFKSGSVFLSPAFHFDKTVRF